MQPAQQRKWLWILFGLSTLLIGGLSSWKFFHGLYNGFDLAIITNSIHLTGTGRLFGSSIHPPSYLGDHAPLILLILTPLYKLLPSGLTLLWLQALAIGLTAWPAWRLSKLFLGRLKLSTQQIERGALWLTGAWLLNPLLHNAALFEFHFLPFALLPLLWAGVFFIRHAFWPFLAAAAIALLVREDVSLAVAGFGLLAVWERRGLRWWLAPLLISVVYFAAMLQLINAAGAGGYKFFLYYSWLGETPIQAIQTLLTRPDLALVHLLRLRNIEFLLGLLLPFGLVALWGGRYLWLIFLPLAQILFQNSGGTVTHLFTHYTLLLLPGLLISTLAGLARLRQKTTKVRGLLPWLQRDQRLRWLLGGTVVIYTCLALGPLVGIAQAIGQRRSTTLAPALRTLIPPDAAVAATYTPLSQLANRERIYSFNYVMLGAQQYLRQAYRLPADTEFVVLDMADFLGIELQYAGNPFFSETYKNNQSRWPAQLADFGLVAIHDSQILLRRGAQNMASLISRLERPAPDNLNGVEQNRVGGIELLGYTRADNQFSFFWQVHEAPAQNYYLILRLKRGEYAFEKFYPLSYGLVPTTDWQPNETWQTNFWFNPNIPAGSYTAQIQVAHVEGGVEINNIRSVEPGLDRNILLGPEFSLGQLEIGD